RSRCPPAGFRQSRSLPQRSVVTAGLRLPARVLNDSFRTSGEVNESFKTSQPAPARGQAPAASRRRRRHTTFAGTRLHAPTAAPPSPGTPLANSRQGAAGDPPRLVVSGKAGSNPPYHSRPGARNTP